MKKILLLHIVILTISDILLFFFPFFFVLSSAIIIFDLKKEGLLFGPQSEKTNYLFSKKFFRLLFITYVSLMGCLFTDEISLSDSLIFVLSLYFAIINYIMLRFLYANLVPKTLSEVFEKLHKFLRNIVTFPECSRIWQFWKKRGWPILKSRPLHYFLVEGGFILFLSSYTVIFYILLPITSLFLIVIIIKGYIIWVFLFYFIFCCIAIYTKIPYVLKHIRSVYGEKVISELGWNILSGISSKALISGKYVAACTGGVVVVGEVTDFSLRHVRSKLATHENYLYAKSGTPLSEEQVRADADFIKNDRPCRTAYKAIGGYINRFRF